VSGDALAVWRALMSPANAALLDAAAAVDASDVAQVARLRKRWSQELVRAALDLSAARRKAAAKFPAMADRMVADAAGVEQASSMAVATHKAQRFAEQSRVLDLCCGIGGDALALRHAATQVIGIDRDPLRAWMTRQNSAVETVAADVADVDVRGACFHIDPARRSDGGRLWRLDDYQPGPDVLQRLWRESDGGGAKLGPGVDLSHPALPGDAEVELISDAGVLVQAVVWSGRLSRGGRTATRLPGGETVSGEAGDVPTASDAGAFVLEVDPALQRAELVHEVAGPWRAERLHPRMDLLTAPQRVDSAWVTCFEVVEQMPWRADRVRDWLRTHNSGVVEVKTRGKAVNPDVVQPALRGDGDQTYTVFLLRLGERVVALITRRCR